MRRSFMREHIDNFCPLFLWIEIRLDRLKKEIEMGGLGIIKALGILDLGRSRPILVIFVAYFIDLSFSFFGGEFVIFYVHSSFIWFSLCSSCDSNCLSIQLRLHEESFRNWESRTRIPVFLSFYLLSCSFQLKWKIKKMTHSKKSQNDRAYTKSRKKQPVQNKNIRSEKVSASSWMWCGLQARDASSS